ncbi:VCBS repeat-containing protein [Candidatus Fermentibacteria bacterium]|nr:VCBS repeat-containing protein [Candidatus Fermentibacteria bacterium]
MGRLSLFVTLAILAHTASAGDYAPGRLVVKLEPAAASQLLSGGATGNAALDDYFAALRPRQVRRLAAARRDGRNEALRRRFGSDGVLAFSFTGDRDPAAVAAKLADMPGVVYAHPDYYARIAAEPNDPLYPHQYAMPRMSMPAAWDIARGSASVIIGISDTGTDWNHPDLRDIIRINPAEDVNGNSVFDNFPADSGGDLDGIDADGNGYVDDVIGWDFVTADNVAEGEDGLPPDPDPMDFDGHGTATAGIAGAATDNGVFVAGTSWGCTIMPLRTFYRHPSGSGTAVASDIIEAFYYAADNGVDVLSMSFRSGGSEGLEDAALYAHAAGVFLVASAGNEGSETAPAPAGYPQVLAVAATQQQDLKASFSNYGAWVGVSAPGVDIWTTAFDDTYMADFGGTSASCPYVAGMAGLLLSHNPSLTNVDLYYRLVGTADEIDSVNPEFRGALGCGRLNGFRALTESPHPALRLVAVQVDDTTGGNGDGLLGPGETAILSFAVRNYWEDAPTVAGAVLSADPHITVDSTSTVMFGPIPTDSVVASPEGICVTVSTDAEIGYHVPFTLRLTSGAYTEDVLFHIPMAAQMLIDAAADFGLSGVSGGITAVFADYDGDDDPDLYRSAWSGTPALYRNDGDTLIDVTASAGLPVSGQGQGAAWGDYDNDGDPDLARGTAAGLALFRNDDGVFTDVSASAGFSSSSPRNFAPVWGDFDNDGWLDLFVTHQQQVNQLLCNNGDGTFTDVASTAGVASDSVSYGASWADFDRDGDLDLFVANYGSVWQGQVNQFYVNQGDGTFLECAASLGLADEALISTGGLWGDYDGDGWLDLYVTNKGSAGQPNRLYRNIQGAGFVRQPQAGLEDPRSSSSAAWVDFDGDGRLDLLVSNTQGGALYRNFGSTFGDATESAPLAFNGLVAAVADLDGDGDDDIYVGSPAGDRILLNLSDPASALRVCLEGAPGPWGSPRDAAGARVTLDGCRRVTRTVHEGSAWGQSSPILTMPWLGDAESAIVEWPSGTIQRVDLAGPGMLSIVEARPTVDLALRAMGLPLAISHGESRLKVCAAVQDNGTTPCTGNVVTLAVADEGGITVYTDSLSAEDAPGPIAGFDGVPAPPSGASYTYTVTAVALGDEAAWNNEQIQIVTGGEPHEDFELPPVYWDLPSSWRWARSSPVHPAFAGEGLLVLEASEDEPAALSPFYPVTTGTVVAVRFMGSWSLGSDSVVVTVRQVDLDLGRLVLGGTAHYWGHQVLEFQVAEPGDIQVEWRSVAANGGDPDAFFRVDDVEVVVVASGQPETMPTVLSVFGPWPNPTRGTLTWSLSVPRAATGRLEAYDLLGRRAVVHDLGFLPSGTQRVVLNTDRLAPGIYVARFTVESSTCVRPFVRLR